MPNTVIIEGVVDVDPPNQLTSFIRDTNPTFGILENAATGDIVEMRSGTAILQEFVITFINLNKSRLFVAENLFAAGVRAGDSYRVFFASANYIDVRDINIARLQHNQPDSARNWQDFRDKIELVEDIIRGAFILIGIADSVVTTTLTDTDPTDGMIEDVAADHITEATTSTIAERKRFRVASTTATTLVHVEDAASEGLVAGDRYRVVHGLLAAQIDGHDHCGTDSRSIGLDDLGAYSLLGGLF